MILQRSNLYWGSVQGSYKPCTRLGEEKSVAWAKHMRSHASGFSSSLRRRNDPSSQHNPTFKSKCWSVLSSSSSAISSSISSSHIERTCIPLGKVPLVALLMTPAHIRLLGDTPDFISKVIRNTFEVSETGQKFDVLAAVVDRIPYPLFNGPADSPDNGASAEPKPPAQQSEEGSEGVSFAVLDSKTAAPDLWTARTEFKELETMTIQQRCTLSFAFPPCAIPLHAIPDGEETTQPLVSRVMQLPVANTLFQNGQTSTLIAQQWKSEKASDSTISLSCSLEVKLPEQILHMTDVFSDQITGLDQSLHSCLTPITPTRTVTAAIGNIIRRISAGGPSDDDVPASEELERAISTAIRNGRIPAEQAGIWALIRPPNYPSLEQPGVSVGDAADEEIQQAISSGCQLHKVLSGGGGWGEKQGLLALDPDSDYRINSQTFEPPQEEDQDVESEKLQAFGELVNPGDTVKFYVHKPRSIPVSIGDPSPKFETVDGPPSVAMRFGSLPSSMDAMPNTSSTGDVSSQPDCMVVNHHFGMLSEQGMSMKSTFLETDLPASKIRYLVPKLLTRGLPPFEVLDEFVLTTKLDAPYMTWSIKEEVHEIDLSSGLAGNGSKSHGGNASVHAPSKRIKKGNHAVKSRTTRLTETNPGTLDDFMEAMSNMPSHQHVATVPSVLGRPSRGKGKAGEAGVPREAPVRPLVRKFKKAGLELGAAYVSLSAFSQVQSHIQKFAKSSREKENTMDRPRYPDDEASQKLQPLLEPPSVKVEDVGAVGGLQPIFQMQSSLRIRKHGAKMPSLLHQLLPQSVRRSVILERLSPEDNNVAAREDLAGSDSGNSVQVRVHDGWNAWNKQQSEKKTDSEVRTETSRVRLIPERIQRDSPSELRPKMDASSMDQRTYPEERLRLSGRVIREISTPKEGPSVVRRHLALVSKGERQITPKALRNHEMASSRIEGDLEKKRPPISKLKEKLVKKDVTWGKLPAHKQLQALQISKHPSHEAPPFDARDKAKRLHQEYHLPLMDERQGDAPRP